MLALCKRARQASRDLARTTADQRSQALRAIGTAIEAQRDEILGANAIDQRHATETTMAPAMLDHLRLDETGVTRLAAAVAEVDGMPVPPRGGEGLIRFVSEHSRIPVIRHSKGVCQAELRPAREEDCHAEYVDAIVAIRVVDGFDAAVDHIQCYGSSHTEAIATADLAIAQQFMAVVHSSTVIVNASTRLAASAELGLGAEMGISTSKLHAYGPMGAEGDRPSENIRELP